MTGPAVTAPAVTAPAVTGAAVSGPAESGPGVALVTRGRMDLPSSASAA